MQDSKFDKIIGDKLRGYTEDPAPDIFARIEQSLAQQGVAAAKIPGKRGPLFYAVRIGAAAAVLFGLALGYVALNKKGGEQLPDNLAGTTTLTVPDNSEKQTSLTEETLADKDSRVRRKESSKNDKVSVSDIFRKAIEEDPRAADIIKAMAENRGAPLSGGNEIVAVMTGLDIPELVTPLFIKDNVSPVSVKPASQVYTQTYWNEIFREDRSKQRSGNRLIASVYGGNLGGGGDYRSSDASALLSSKMKVNEVSGMADANRVSENSPEYAASSDALLKSSDEQVELVHRMPMNFGITLAYPISDRLSIVSGLNYSYLRSQSKKDSGMADYKMKREMHYIGIPLGVNYTFYSTGKFDFYLYGGGMIEKAFSARDITEYSAGSGKTKLEKKFNVKGIQPSIRVSAGASFDIARGVSIYVEPGVAYYFEQINSYATYRTEHPTSFSLTLGVRFGL